MRRTSGNSFQNTLIICVYTIHPEIILGVFFYVFIYYVAALGHPPSQIIQLRYIYPCCFLSCTANASSFRFAKFLLHTHNGVVFMRWSYLEGCATHIFGAKQKYY